MTGCKNFVGKRKKFIFNAFVDLKPVERFANGSDPMGVICEDFGALTTASTCKDAKQAYGLSFVSVTDNERQRTRFRCVTAISQCDTGQQCTALITFISRFTVSFGGRRIFTLRRGILTAVAEE